MPHLSKYRLDEKTTKKIMKELVAVIDPKSSAETRTVLENLLTETEQIMLAKRLAAILMISEGASIYKIATHLNLSTSTVKRLYLHKQNKEYGQLLGVIQQRKLKKEEFWNFMGSVSRLGMPSMGKDRWKSLR